MWGKHSYDFIPRYGEGFDVKKRVKSIGDGVKGRAWSARNAFAASWGIIDIARRIEKIH